MNAPTACFMFAHKTKGEQRAISTKQISGVVTLVISDCLHERGAVTHRCLTILGLRYIV